MKDLVEWANAAAVIGVQVLGMLLTLAVIVILWRAQGAPQDRNPFDAAQMFQDENNRTSSSKFIGLIGGMASIWIVVYLAVTKELDPTLFIGWLTVIVVGKVATEAVAKIGEGK